MKPRQELSGVLSEETGLAPEAISISTLTPSPIAPLPATLTTIIPTPTPTLIAMPTSTVQARTGSEGGNNYQAENRFYSGVPLPAPDEKRQLFSLSDTLPDSSSILINEKTKFTAGKFGGALQFLPGGKLLVNSNEEFANSGTVSFWLKMEPGGDAGEFPIIAWNYDTQNYQDVFEISFAEPVLIFSLYEKVGENQNAIMAELKDLGNWHKVVVTWDLTSPPFKRVIYIDNSQVAEGIMPFAPILTNPQRILIGGDLRGGLGKTTTLDEITIYNWAKSEEDMVEQ